MLQNNEPFRNRTDNNPNDLRSWAKRTGFVSGETTGASSRQHFDNSHLFDASRDGRNQRGDGLSPKIEIDPILGPTRPNGGTEMEPDSGFETGTGLRRNEGTTDGLGNQRRRVRDEGVLGNKVEERRAGLNRHVNKVENRFDNVNRAVNRNRDVNEAGDRNGQGDELPAAMPPGELKNEDSKVERDVEFGIYPGDGEERPPDGWSGQSAIKIGL